MKNPYEHALGTRDALEALGDTPERIGSVVARMTEDDFARSYAPGKWTTAQLLDHLAETELVFGLRVRMALIVPGYVVQPFDQDKMLAFEGRHTGREAFEAYYAQRRWNLPLYRRLTPAERTRPFQHPERGEINIDDLLALVAGHELHHLAHLEQVASR